MGTTRSVCTRVIFIAGLVLMACSCKPSLRKDVVSGTIETDEVRVASRYGGRVETIHVAEGQAVKAGQLLATLSAPELRARRDNLAAQLSELEAGPRKEEIAAAKHDLEAVVAQSEQARTDAQRAVELFQQKTISATEHELAITRAEALEKNVAAAKSRYDLLVAGTRPEKLSQARAQLAEIDTQLKEMDVLAPGDSVVEVINVKVGDVVAPNRELATLLLIDHLWVRVYVPEPWLGRIALGETVQIGTDSHPEKVFSGTVEQIARQAEFTPRNVQTVGERIKQVFGIKVRLDNRESQLRAGMAADVKFPNLP